MHPGESGSLDRDRVTDRRCRRAYGARNAPRSDDQTRSADPGLVTKRSPTPSVPAGLVNALSTNSGSPMPGRPNLGRPPLGRPPVRRLILGRPTLDRPPLLRPVSYT